MNCIKYTIIAVILLTGCRTTAQDLHEVATGWRLPTATEITGDWKLFAEPNNPVHEALADFNFGPTRGMHGE
jgi:hypothetical protein